MHFILNRVNLVVFLVVSLLAGAGAQTPVWHQGWDVQSTIPYSAKTTDNVHDQELADDFDLVGRIDSLKVEGGYITYFNSPPMNLQGAFVRIYAWSAGAPGALQYERFVPASSIQVTSDQVGNYTMRFSLPDPFNATGKHFISVQAVADLPWSWHSANTVEPRGARVMRRYRATNSAWAEANPSDAAMTLYGEVIGNPRIDSVSDVPAPRSGRIRIFGANFGQVQGTGRVVIGGRNAFVTRWTASVIHAYVPEATELGETTAQVVTDAGPSTPTTITVTARTSPGGRARWRFRVDAPQIFTSTLVGPDGTIYAMDDHAHLYALTPDGGLKWVTVAGGQGSQLTQGPDGTLYVMADGILTAVRPDGTIKWHFTHPQMNWTLSGPTVGPDGNIYGTVQYGLGFFSVTPEGQLRWSNPRVGDRVPRGHRIVFSHGQAYINHTHLDFPVEELMAFDMQTGQLRWIRDAHRDYQPLIGPGGRIYVENLMGTWSSRIYNPDGSLFLSREFSIGQRNFSPDLSKLYARAFSYAQISAIDSLSLNTIWTFNSGNLGNAPVADPFDRILLSHENNPGEQGHLLALTTGGQFLWRETMPFENGGRIVLSAGIRYSADGQTAYTGSVILGQDVANEYAYVYAFDVAEEAAQVAPSSFALGTGVLVAGGIAELADSDDQRLVVRKAAVAESPDMQIVIEGISPRQTTTGITLVVESSQSHGAGGQVIEAYNFATGAWVRLDTTPGRETDGVRTLNLTTNPGSYIEAGTGKMRVRLTYVLSTRLVRSWMTALDQVRWTVR